MNFSADILIERPRQIVWQLFTNPIMWAKWWGGELKSVEPGWKVGGSAIWALGNPSKISECVSEERLTIVGSGNVRNTFVFEDAGAGKTKVTYSEDYAGASVSVSDPARRQSECRAVVAKLKRHVESLSATRDPNPRSGETKSPSGNSVEFFRGVNVDWLRLKWYFLAFSMIFSVAGIISMAVHMHTIGSPVPLGVDFKGGTQVQVQFVQAPDVDRIRQAMDAAGIRDASIQTIKSVDQPNSNEVLISLPEQTNEAALDTGRRQIVDALQAHYDNPATVIKTDVVGPTVGRQLEKQALLATLYSMAGMLVYLWFRFQLIYGVAAVVACFHDTLITVGAFALTNQEISLTVIAAILTLVGYSMNDTIVVFDRIRENLRLSRRESLPDVVNRSINQTLSRTVLTSGLTFLTVLSLYIFGGQVLRGFSFALVVGILIGTYSSIAVAAPMLVAWQEWRARQGKTAVLPAAKRARV